MKDITLWKITDKDDFIHVRAGAWEVGIATDDGKGCNTITVSGPDAKKLSQAIKDWLETERLLS